MKSVYLIEKQHQMKTIQQVFSVMLSNFTRGALILQCYDEHRLIGPQFAAVVLDRVYLRFQL